uniref:Uncharacterized protein n=1 Tax=Rhodopseudomonas palustris (strain BisA53) TaxID=316055 RepID=Q07QK3_RHOP5
MKAEKPRRISGAECIAPVPGSTDLIAQNRRRWRAARRRAVRWLPFARAIDKTAKRYPRAVRRAAAPHLIEGLLVRTRARRRRENAKAWLSMKVLPSVFPTLSVVVRQRGERGSSPRLTAIDGAGPARHRARPCSIRNA